jgi:hypothetical protein
MPDLGMLERGATTNNTGQLAKIHVKFRAAFFETL